MNKYEYQSIDARFRSIFDHYATQLSKEGRENVQHFVEATEVEMACESFVLSLLEENVQISDAVRKALLDLVLALQLDQESVFRADFWQLASSFLGGKG